MEIDTSAMADVQSQLDKIDVPDEQLQLLVDHLRDRLVGHFGAETFDVWRAKEGLHRHSAEEFAAVTVAKLAPLLNTLPADLISSLAEAGEIATPVAFPWDETFPFG